MTDLQCPARFLVCAVGERTALDLRHERVAAVYDGTPHRAGPGLAAELHVRSTPVTHPVSVDDVVAREPRAMEVLVELADLHRGETVVVTVCGATGRRVDVSVDGDGVLLLAVGSRAERPQAVHEA